MNKKVLIFAAHPDDEILGCSGVIQKYIKNNDRVVTCVVTDGSSSQYPGNKKVQLKKRKECKAANKYLGIDEVIFLDFPDMRLDTVSHVDLNNELKRVFDTIHPDVIYTHSADDLNNDHKCICNSIRIIARPGSKYLQRVYEYEVLSSSELSRDAAFLPNTFVELDEKMLKKKKKAFSFYTSEVRTFPHARSNQGIETLAMYRGIQSGYYFAEAFRLIVDYSSL